MQGELLVASAALLLVKLVLVLSFVVLRRVLWLRGVSKGVVDPGQRLAV